MSRQSSRNIGVRIALLRSRIERNPANAALFQALGKAYLKIGSFEEAESAYRRSLELAPDDPWTRLFLGNVFYARRQYREALSEFERTRELAPHIAMPYICMADAYHC